MLLDALEGVALELVVVGVVVVVVVVVGDVVRSAGLVTEIEGRK